jgi:serine/threonine protein kinase
MNYCDQNIQIIGDSILVKKERKFVINETKVYSLLKDAPDIPKLKGINTCVNPEYSIIIYQLLQPYDNYRHIFKGSLFKGQIIQYFNDVIQSYLFLLSKNIIHNDLKPQNILYNNFTNKYTLSDFDRSIIVPNGISREHLKDINKDFLRFITVFQDEYESLNSSDLTYKQSYIEFIELIKLVKMKLKNTHLDTDIETYIEFIKSMVKKLNGKILLVNGGKNNKNTIKIKLKKNIIKSNLHKQYGINPSSNNKTKTRNKLSSYRKSKRKIRYLYW